MAAPVQPITDHTPPETRVTLSAFLHTLRNTPNAVYVGLLMDEHAGETNSVQEWKSILHSYKSVQVVRPAGQRIVKIRGTR